ncbi:hypothetical protein B0H17DRAFT_713989 [Mycena rosella]|uniref:BTB domain-containing protein n=1 Tax=Mycena rosella TaxID=1033263 RepID=A0AAD7GFK4_MYCRO|nr:hypothetical protein B0H17DRAFT_713989 [Mycena rosella]
MCFYCRCRVLRMNEAMYHCMIKSRIWRRRPYYASLLSFISSTMSALSRPVKRQRTESAPSITRSSSVWYEDGSVVLQVESTQFKVHWGVLAQHSSFFHDMQGLPQPLDQPSVDGCAIVELLDPVVDVEHLLKALYHSTPLFKEALEFPVVAALIRLGRKYDFRNLLDIAVECLTLENPATILEYDARIFHNRHTPNRQRITPYPGLLFDMITLARENDIFTALPCAYYRAITTHDWASLFDGVPRGDGTCAALPAIDQRAFILGRERILHAQCANGNTFGWLRSWANRVGCSNPALCNAWRDQICDLFLTVPRLMAIPEPTSIRSWTVRLCDPCAQHVERSVAAGRMRMWDALPALFDLPPWTELKNDP